MTLSGMKCSMIVRAHGEFAGLVGVISNRAGVCCRSAQDSRRGLQHRGLRDVSERRYRLGET